MSLLKLLFDIPEAGGESNFTVEEQEELMAFEHNLDDHLVGNFALPATDDQLNFLQGAGLQTEASLESVQDRVVFPVAYGTHNRHEVDSNHGAGVGKEVLPLMSMVIALENGHELGSSTIDHVTQELSGIVAPRTQEPVSLEQDSVPLKPLVPVLATPPENTACSVTLEPALVTLENAQVLELAVNSLQKDASSKKDHTSLKHQESGKAVWIKWRGKWQAAIQVRVEDCRVATLKAMPTYRKKEYVPIYLLTNRTYIWIDAQNICDISQNPEPLVTGLHSDWLRLVVDTGAPRRRTFLSLGWEMLDISDRLHILGVVERARYVSAWKEFAREATEATKYSELGSLLVRIHAVVEPVYVRQSWVKKRLSAWTEECIKAGTAAAVEKLTKECIRVILWDEAATLWEAPEQPVLDPGWTDWKGPAFDELTLPEDDIPVPADKTSRPFSSLSITPSPAQEKQYTGAKRGRKPKDRSVQSQHLASATRVTTRKQVKVETRNDAGPSSSAAMGTLPTHSMKNVQNYSTDHAEKTPDQVGGNTFATPVKDDGAVVKIEQLNPQLSDRRTQKHLKGAASNGNGGSKISGLSTDPINDKNLSRLVANMSVREKRSFIKARELLCQYMNEGLSLREEGNDGAQCNQMIDSIIDEFAKDLLSGEMLLKILASEKDRLAKIVLEGGLVSRKSSNIIWDVGLSGSHSGEFWKPEVKTVSNDASAWQSTPSPVQIGDKGACRDTRYLCSLCGQNFEQLCVLGKHWKEQHKREARLFEKCLLCRICDKSNAMFRNKTSVTRHLKKTHPNVSMSSQAWSVCLMCDKEYLDFDHLWQHVEDQHHNQWSNPDFARRVKSTLKPRMGQKRSFYCETFNTLWEVKQHKQILHRGPELLRSGTKRNFDAMNSMVTANDSKRVDVMPAKDTYKYSCRYCPMKFPVLPDLGRHHRTKHKDKTDELVKDQFPTNGMPSVQTRKTKHEETRGDWHPVPTGKGGDRDDNGKKWRYRARAKAKNASRGRSVSMKKRSGGAEAILQRMRAVKQVLKEQKKKRSLRKRDRKAESARRLAKLAGISGTLTPAPARVTTTDANRFKCRFCGMRFALLPDLAQHHQVEHSAVKQAFIANGRGECQTGIYTLTNDGIIGPLQGELLNRVPTAKSCWRLLAVPAVRIGFLMNLARAKLEIRWHQDKYLCPDGCKTYGAIQPVPSLEIDRSALAKSSSNACAGNNSQVGCSCTEDECSASTCDHMSMFDTDNTEAFTIDGKFIRGQFPYDEFGRIILDVGYMVYECNSSCQCKDPCRNRVLQKGVHLKLEVFISPHKGWGVRAAEAISRGTFVCEYVGEVLNDSEANKRGKRYDQVGCSYLYNIDAHLDVVGVKSISKPFVIDATKYGNVARFINHG
uniref:Uncharacterized protein n=1 Tax=Physcomitrium patens TaxID=3218 RepID=A0A7I4BQG6_PHYPA